MNTRSGIRTRRLAAVLVLSVAAQLNLVHAQSAMQILTAGCADDARKFCSDVQPGGGRVIACLKQNQDSLSDKCKQAAAQASRMSAASAPTTVAPAAPPTGSPVTPTEATGAPIAAPAATPQAASGTSGSSSKPARTSSASVGGKPTTAGAGGSYLVMRKVQITGPGPDATHATVPAFDLMIPSAWKIQGGVVFGGSPSGCFADIYALSLRATNEDESTVFAAGPDYSWQYADDPSVLKSLNDPNRRALGVGGKPCPVAKPMKA
jgi:hypothetical protein